MFILDVAEKIQTSLYAHAYVSMDFVLDAQHKVDDHHKGILRKHARTAHDHGVTKVHLLMANSDSPGEMICHTAKEKAVDFIVVGRRGMGTLKRLLLGSVSRYVLEHAHCDVIVVKGEYGPDEVHEGSKQEAKRAEEIERNRRIAEEKAADAAEVQAEKFRSDLDRNVARLAEEEERQRRVQELADRHKREQQEREQELQRVKLAEEEERRQRVANDPEAHPPHFPFPAVQFLDKAKSNN